MKRSLLILLAAVWGLPNSCLSQEYCYTHYDIAQGLPSSRLYCITQDKDGFIWIGTAAGVCRFDGSHFRNYTTRDGVPGLEVPQLFADSRGRIWMAPLHKSVCYYLDGRIHSAQNDPLLAGIRLHQNIESFAEDASGDILMQERNMLHLLRKDGSLVNYDSLEHEPIRRCLKVNTSASGHFLAQMDGKVIEFSGKGILWSTRIRCPCDHPNDVALSPRWVVYKSSAGQYAIGSLLADNTSLPQYDTIHSSHITFSIVGD